MDLRCRKFLALVLLFGPAACAFPAMQPVAPLKVAAAALNQGNFDCGAERSPLQFRGGIVLSSGDPHFGGLSSLRWSKGWLHSLSDQDGTWYRVRPYEVKGRLAGIRAAQTTHLLDEAGRPLQGKREADAEAIEFPSDDVALVALERDDRVLRYKRHKGMPFGVPQRESGFEDWLSRQPDNLGVEAMAGDADRTLLVSEGLTTADGSASALLIQPGLGAGRSTERRIREIGLPVHGEARPSDLVQLDRDDFILLRRSWTKETGFFVMMEQLQLQPDAGKDGASLRCLAQFRRPGVSDNFEGVAVRRDGAHIYLYVVSDDNFSSDQQTILLKFELPGKGR